MKKEFDINNLSEEQVLNLLNKVDTLYSKFIEDFKVLIKETIETEVIYIEDPYIALANNDFLVEVSKKGILFFESSEDGVCNSGLLNNGELKCEKTHI